MKDRTFLEVLKRKMLLPDEMKDSLEQMDRAIERSSYFLERIIKAGFDKGNNSCLMNLLAAMIESSYDNVKDLGIEIQSKLRVVQGNLCLNKAIILSKTDGRLDNIVRMNQKLNF